MGFFGVDASEWQVPIDDSYPLPWFTFRVVNESPRTDRNAAANLAGSERLCTAGRMAGYSVYVVYWPGQVDAIMACLREAVPNPSKFTTGMVDVESWGGQISGDHTAEIEQLCSAMDAYLGCATELAYGNSQDLSSVFPGRTRCPAVRAKYSSVAPTDDHLGWQYSDGSPQFDAPAGWPATTAPFGACDHDYYDTTPADLLALLKGDDMYEQADRDRDAKAAAQIAALFADSTQEMLAAWAILGDKSNAGLRALVAQTIANEAQILAKVGTTVAATPAVDPKELAADIEAALGPDLAKQVVDALAARLATPAPAASA